MVKKVDDKDIKKNKKVEKKKSSKEKAYFSQRLLAFIIDFCIITIVSSIITTPFINQEKTNKLSDESMTIIDNYVNGDIDINTYFDEFTTVSFKLAQNSGIQSLIVIVFNILYFVVYQVYSKGQTIGKKIMKIRVVSDDGDLLMNQMIFRSLISNFIFIDIVSFIFMLISKNSVYFYSVAILEIIQFIVAFVSIVMILNRKDGRAIHDKLVHTSVVRV